MAFSVISLKKESDADYQKSAEKGIKTFAFLAKNAKGKKLKGTIDAPDRKNAFRRLVAEYNFEILSLADATIPENERAEKGKDGLEDLAAEVAEEFGVQFRRPKNIADEEKKQNEAFLERKKELVKSVEEIVAQAKELLKKFEDDLTGDEVQLVKSRIDDLMRMRLSNNLKYVQDLSDELLTLIDDTLREHADDESVAEEAEDIAEDIVDETKYENAIESKNLLTDFRHASKKLTRLFRGYKKNYSRAARRRKFLQKSKKPNPFFLKIRVAMRYFSRGISHGFRLLFAKNAAVRQKHLQIFREDFGQFFSTFRKSFDEIAAVEKDLFASAPVPAPARKSHFLFQKKFFSALSAARFFFGWILAFYIFYFYFGIFLITKFHEKNEFFRFFERSLTTGFPFLVTGIFFLLFFGLTLATFFSGKKIWRAVFFLFLTAAMIFLFVVNF